MLKFVVVIKVEASPTWFASDDELFASLESRHRLAKHVLISIGAPKSQQFAPSPLSEAMQYEIRIICGRHTIGLAKHQSQRYRPGAISPDI
jgi:hypothetical protein